MTTWIFWGYVTMRIENKLNCFSVILLSCFYMAWRFRKAYIGNIFPKVMMVKNSPAVYVAWFRKRRETSRIWKATWVAITMAWWKKKICPNKQRRTWKNDQGVAAILWLSEMPIPVSHLQKKFERHHVTPRLGAHGRPNSQLSLDAKMTLHVMYPYWCCGAGSW